MNTEAALPPQPRIRPVVWLVLGLLVVGIAVALWYSPTLLLALFPKVEFSMPQTTEPPPPAERLPEEFASKPLTYGAPPVVQTPPAPVPIAQPSFPKAPPVAAPKPDPPPAPVVKAATDPLPDFLKLWEAQDKKIDEKLAQMSEQNARQQYQPGSPPGGQAIPAGQRPGPPPGSPAGGGRKSWIITPTDITLKRDTQGKETQESKEQKDTQTRTNAALDLIKHATWARPIDPCRTIYMSQRLPGSLLRALNSDEPGITPVRITIPIWDKETRRCEIIPKDSIALIKQEGKPNFGESTLKATLIQIEPTGRKGEVIKFGGDVADAEGNGLRGKTNNHYDKLGLAVLINMGLSLGLNSIGGTPGRGQYYADPIQQAGRDASQSASGDVRSIVNAQLKTGPTITKQAGEFVEIQLLDNTTFVRQPVVVK